MKRQAQARRFGESWFTFWQGAAIVYFFGIRGAATWCLAWLLLALGVRIGLLAARGR